MSQPTIEVLFAPSVVGSDYGDRLIWDVGVWDTNTLGDGALFYDITSFVRSISTSRGRSRALDRFGTGTATIVLDNRDRRFDPTNTAGPYYNSTISVSGVVPSIPIKILATLDGDNTYPVFHGFIDGWQFAYGPAGIGDATATITCSDAFKSLSTVIGGLPNSSSITSSGTTTVQVATSSLGTSTGSSSTAGGLQVVSTTSSGNVKVASDTTTTPVIGVAGELSGARINRILDAANWPADLRNIDTGTTALAAQNATQTVLELLQEVAATESGALYVEDGGSVVFADRYSLISDDRSLNSIATYDTTAAGGKHFVDVEVAYDDELIYNVVAVSRKSTSTSTGDSLTGTTVIVSNVESQSLYGARALELELPIPTTVDGDGNYGQSVATNLALFLASIYANPELRPASVTFIAEADEAQLYPEVLGRRIFDRVTVKFAVPGGGSAIQRDCFIEQISHDITPERWQTRFGLSSATYYTGFLILDDAQNGLLDTNKLAY